MKTISTSLLILAVALAASAHAGSVTVGNFDFTSPSVPSSPGYVLASNGDTAVPDWTFVDPESVSGVSLTGNTPVGQQAFANNISDGLGSFPLNTFTYSGINADALPTIAANTSYTLTVALGVPGGSFPDTLYTLSLQANGANVLGGSASIDSNLLTLQPASGGYASGTFYDFSVTLDAATIAADNLTNETLGIQLASQIGSTALPYSDATPDFSQSYFSDVRLTADAVPEPSTWALMVAALSVMVFLARRRLA